MPNCATPGEYEVVVRKGISVANCRLYHCEDGYMYLEVKLTPRNLGVKVKMQGFIKVENQGWKQATREVIFCDDDSVMGYGDASNGVRFPQRAFDYKKDHEARMTAIFI